MEQTIKEIKENILENENSLEMRFEEFGENLIKKLEDLK